MTDRSQETTESGIPWSVFAGHRARVRDRFCPLWSMRLVTSALEWTRESLPECDSVLDVGATTRVWKPTVERLWPDAQYKSLDLDRTHPHDYHDWADIDRGFDLVICQEVLEHVPPDLAFDIVKRCMDAARPGATLLFTVPNPFAPPFGLEFTHRTYYLPQDVGGLILAAGGEVRNVCRWWTGGTTRRYHINRTLLWPLHKLMHLDFAQSVATLATKPG